MDQTKPLAFGAVIRESELSDFELGAFTGEDGVPLTYMPSYGGITPSKGIAIEMQSHQPACGSHSASEVMDILKGEERDTIVRVSPEYAWKLIKSFDGLPIEMGTDIVSLMKAMVKGLCDYDLMPNKAETETLAAYADFSTVTNDMQLNAVNNSLDSVYAFTNSPTMQQIKNAIFAHKAVVLCVSVGDEWWVPSWKESDILPLKTGRPNVSGHFVTAFAYDEQYVYFYNHWSGEWGRAGIGYFADNYLSHVMCIGTIVNLQKAFSFTRRLKAGASGTDVGVLQMILKKEGVFPTYQKVTSYYGPITQEAVTKLQEKYAAEILTPLGLNHGTGNFYESTMKFINNKYHFKYGKI